MNKIALSLALMGLAAAPAHAQAAPHDIRVELSAQNNSFPFERFQGRFGLAFGETQMAGQISRQDRAAEFHPAANDGDASLDVLPIRWHPLRYREPRGKFELRM